jgi:uncharacterized membrane protein YphA (DoxX/SURF4 family)
MHWKRASHLFFAVTMIAMGVIGLLGGSFAPIWNSVPKDLPGRESLAFASSLVSLVTGAGLLARRSAAPAALILFLALLAWTLAFKVPFIVHSPLEEVTYQSCGENAVLIAAAWLLYAEFARNRTFPAGDLGLRIAYLLYGLALIAFGLSHFFYLQMTAPLVPSWLPAHVFWAYLTGGIYLATGLAIALGLAPHFAAFVAAIQIALITFLVWGPMLLAGNLTAMHWQETAVSWALTAGAWVMATGSPPATGSIRFPSRQGRLALSDRNP